MTERLRVRLNGAAREVEPGTPLARLVASLVASGDQEGVAVAVNGEVVLRSRWQERQVRDGDVIEVVRAVQGG